MHMNVKIDGQEYELQISARKIINDGRTAVLLSDSETDALIDELNERGFVYLLIHEQDTDAAWGCDVKVFSTIEAAQNAMRKDWWESVQRWEYDSHDHHDEDEATCDKTTAIIREDSDVESWRIEEQAVQVE